MKKRQNPRVTCTFYGELAFVKTLHSAYLHETNSIGKNNGKGFLRPG